MKKTYKLFSACSNGRNHMSVVFSHPELQPWCREGWSVHRVTRQQTLGIKHSGTFDRGIG